MELLCMILAILCLVYYGILLSIGMDFSYVWLGGGLLMAGIGMFLKFEKNYGISFPSGIKAVAAGIGIIGILIFLVLEVLIFTHMFDKGEESLDYIIVLGAQVRGDVPSKALRRRIEKAEEYLKENPETKAVLSGGQGIGENRSEAEVMREELVNAGIEKERLLIEDASTSTLENLQFSARIIGKEENIGLISQNFHLYRALKLAKKQEYQKICGIAAPSELLYQPHYLVREAFALVKEIAAGNIRIFE